MRAVDRTRPTSARHERRPAAPHNWMRHGGTRDHRRECPHMTKIFEAAQAGVPTPEPEWAKEFALLSDKPDELLR